MNKTIKYIIICILLFFIIICTSACWDRKEIEKFALVKGIAIDKTENNRIKLSVQLVIPRKDSSDGNNATSGSGGCIASATGFNLYDASRNLLKTTGEKPFYAHSEIIIFSEEIAREGLAPFLDYLIREPEIRGRLIIIIARGSDAAEILQSSHITESLSAIGIRHMFNNTSASGVIITTDLINFLKLYFTDTSDPVTSLLEITESKSEKEAKKIAYTSGGALFREDKLVDWLTRKETRGLYWITKPGKIRGPVLINPPGEKEDTEIAVGIFRTKSNIKPEIIERNFAITLKVETEGVIIEDNSRNYYIISDKNLQRLEKYFSQVVRNEISSALSKSQKYGADIFEFGEAIYRKYPQEFLEIKNNWSNLYKNLKVNIEVKADIRRTGMFKQGVSTHEH